MNVKTEFYPYLIGLVIIALTVLCGLKIITFEVLWPIIMILLGVEVPIHISARRRLGRLEKAQGLKE